MLQQSLLNKIKQYLIRNRYSRNFRKFVQFLCCIVVFVTTYALILPAITMEQETFCGKEEHTHSELCQQPSQMKNLICTPEKLEIHVHFEDCYDEEGTLTCGQADYIVHGHDASCYDAFGQLVCILPERSAHIHGEDCYAPAETLPEVLHVHAETCNIQEKGELICLQEEREEHFHKEQCYEAGDVLECLLTENHVHDASCYSPSLSCTLSTEPHVHQDDCYEAGDLCCGILEGHVHTDDCKQEELTCLRSEGGHQHTNGCWETVQVCENVDETHTHGDDCVRTDLVCGLTEEQHYHDGSCYSVSIHCDIPENHMHGQGCYEAVKVCGKEAGETHEHATECYGGAPQLQCQQPENHTHGSACFNQILICELPEDPGHIHEDPCYLWNTVLNCGIEEGQPEPTEPAEPVLICTEPEAPVHVHDETCFEPVADNRVLVCEVEEEGHEHTDLCYGCPLEEHVHTLICYSDPEADVETSDVWEATFAHVSLTGHGPTDLVAIAESQLGYTESIRNYEVWEDNSIHGYTRYGDWYGSPYGDWCAMFVSFCLNYADVDGVPQHWGVRPWISELSARGLYYSAKETKPQKGNLIFFDWERDGLADHVGIVADAQEAQEHTGASVKAIEGNSSDCVRYVYYSPDDPVILGYGLLPGQERIPVEIVEPGEGDYKVNMDINLGPIVTLTAEEALFKEVIDDERVLLFAAVPRNSPIDLKDHLNTVNGGILYFTLTDQDDNKLPEDESGNIIVTPGTTYKLTMTIKSEDGFAPGTYTYQLPEGLTIIGGNGDLIVKGNNLGTWHVSDAGLMTFDFNQTSNRFTKVTISAEMGASFSESKTYIEFDGDVTVIIQKPPGEEIGTEMNKWGSQGNGSESKPDSDKIYWTISISGRESSSIPGSLITDQITSGEHRYTEEDRNNGLRFGVGVTDLETGEQIDWHAWTVLPGDPKLTWTDTGWSYQIPETVNCIYCGTVTLGNDGWYYYIDYTSTPEDVNINGTLPYTNHIKLDVLETDGWAKFSHGSNSAGVVKSGQFQGDTDGGKFIWEVKATIPGMAEGEKAAYFWYLYDKMFIRDNSGGDLGYAHNDMNLAYVTITRNGQTQILKNVNEVSSTDDYFWDNSWSPDKNGIVYGREISFLCRCQCTEENCQRWENGKCGGGHWKSGFCHCWTIPDDVEIVFTYETNAVDIIEQFGGNGNLLRNDVELYNKVSTNNGEWTYSEQGKANSNVEIPSLFQKKLTKAFDGYVANYTITLNEAKLTLSPTGTPITIVDKMTDSLAYIAGSMVITTEDADGNQGRLIYGTDYTLTYDGTDHGDHLHVLTIVINNPQPVMYTLNYDTTLIITGDEIEAIEYSNSATVTIWGQDLTVDSEEKIHANINVSARTYHVVVEKTVNGTGSLLPGATFGLYNEAGGLITSQTTDENGRLEFVTSITDGIILREHEPCYIQEISAPEGFILDTTKYWFYFCDSGEGCNEGDPVKDRHPGILRIPGDQVHTFNMVNTMMGYELPATGGVGREVYAVGGWLLILAAGILLYNQKKCRKEDYQSS